MELNRIDDRRDNLQKARRSELAAFARANGVSNFAWEGRVYDNVDEAPAEDTRNFLRSRGLKNIVIPRRTLGMEGNKAFPELAAKNVSGFTPTVEPAPRVKSLDGMNQAELVELCQSMNITLPRGRGIKKMRELIEAARG